MKIVYCVPSLHINGGVERVVSNKASFFAEKMGYDVYIIMTDAKNKKPFFPLSPKVHLIQLDVDFEQLWGLPLWKKIFVYQRLMRTYRKRLSECLCQLRPDITLSTLRREINFLCDIPDGSKKIGELHVNREEFRNLNQDKGVFFIKQFLQKMWNRQLLRSLNKLDQLVVLTERDRKMWSDLPPNKVTAISNPLSFYASQPAPCQAKRAVAVGRFCYQKGFDLLIDTWAKVMEKHPDWKLYIYGDDGEKIQHYVKKLKMEEHVVLHPICHDVQQALQQGSIFILSSRFEGFGMVITEAMACGVPPVAFDCHFGPAEIIKDHEDGLLARNGDTNHLAQCICQLMEDDQLRQQMGAKAHHNVARYHIDVIGKEWVNLFNKLLVQ